MLLPINLFNNVTCYTKTNWQCGLGPAKEITWSKYASPTIEDWSKLNVEAKGNYTKFTFKDEATDSDYIAGALYSAVDQYQGWTPVFKITFNSKEKMDEWNPKTHQLNLSYWGLDLKEAYPTAYYIDEKNLAAYYILSPSDLKYIKANKGQVFKWFSFGATYFIDKGHCKSLEIQMIPVDWLAAGKKAPISVGDKLGLVYWDGTACTNSSCSIGISGLDEANFLIGSYSPDKFGYGLQLFKHESGNDHVYKKLRADDGTVNLSGYGITATHLESTGSGEKLKDHLFHVI